MEQDIRRPDYVPRTHDRASSAFNCFMAAAGLTLMMLCLLGAAAAISAWAMAKLAGLPNSLLLVLVAIFELPVLWVVIWIAGRAWHLERRLASGKDMDQPVFKLLHYLKGGAAA
jgi:hypothetical protein